MEACSSGANAGMDPALERVTIQFGPASMEPDIGSPLDKMSQYHEIMMYEFDGDSTCDMLETEAASRLQEPTTEKSDEADHASASMLDAVKRIEELEDVVLCQARVMDQMSKQIMFLLENNDVAK